MIIGEYSIELYKTKSEKIPFILIKTRMDIAVGQGVLLLNLIDDEFIGKTTLYSVEEKERTDYLIENNVIEIFGTILPQGEFGAKYTTQLVKLTHSKKLEIL